MSPSSPDPGPSLSVRTFPAALAAAVRADAARPLVTFYDDASGERVELSVTTYANWVDKTAGLLQEELDAERGDLLLLDLPTHWLGAVWLGAAWRLGLAVTTDPGLLESAAVVVCGPAGVPTYAPMATDRAVVALSLRPLGARFSEPLPDGVVDYGAEVLAQPDSFQPLDPPDGADAAWRTATGTTSQSALLADAAAEPLVDRRGRLLTDVNPVGARGLRTLLSPLLNGGGTVWVAHPDPQRWQRRYDEERATAQLRDAEVS
jgi:uncharacterized protein (TIGR03089 family)